MWVNNLMYYKREADFDRILADFVDDVALHNVVVVTNETGLGNIPFDGETRRYNLLLAKANRLLAEAATTVEFIVSGLVLKIK
jgi:adenosylcobinamide kinase/adenosylcobinamide-phosphate guanylyltransferase